MIMQVVKGKINLKEKKEVNAKKILIYKENHQKKNT